MNVASLENCKELYELSGWKANKMDTTYKDGDTWVVVPIYDLGYLLRKLPATLHHLSNTEGDGLWLFISAEAESGDEAEGWLAGYGNEEIVNQIEYQADTPEDAICKLAIELFREGILKREAKEDGKNPNQ